MGDLAETVIAKSDQLNADDLVAGPMTITVTGCTVKKGDDQPCSIFFEGDNGKPYKPSKGMRRLLMMAWKTDDSETFIGRSMTLWRNPDVMWAGKKEGGIRISHLSHLDEPATFAVTVSRGKREHIIVKPLQMRQSEEMTIETAKVALSNAKDMDELKFIWSNRKMAPFREQLEGFLADRKQAFAEQESPQSPTPETSPPVEGASPVSGRGEDAEKQIGATSSLWSSLIEMAITAQSEEDVIALQATFDANEDEIPLDRLVEVQEALEAAMGRFG